MAVTVHSTDDSDTAVYKAEQAEQAQVISTGVGNLEVNKGDWIVTHEGGGQRVYTDADFSARFKQGKPAGATPAPAAKKAEAP